MLYNVFLAQLMVYLLIVPIVRDRIVFDYHLLISCSLTAFLGFVVGGFLIRKHRPSAPRTTQLRPSKLLVLAPFLVLAFIVVSLQFGLVDRRQGSFVMAEKFANLPFYASLIIKLYELGFVLFCIVVVYFWRHMNVGMRWALLLLLIVSIGFSGVLGARGRMLVLGLSVLIVLPKSVIWESLKKNLWVTGAGVGIIGIFVFESIKRASASAYLVHNDYIQREVVRRLDGLNLLEAIYYSDGLSFFGSWRVEFLFPAIISKIPLLPLANELKRDGLTSTKQFILRNIVESDRIDSPNSMATDLMYFGGYPLLFVGFFFLGREISKYDRIITNKRLPEMSFFGFSAIIAFGQTVITLESDFAGVPFIFIQNLILFYALSRLFLKQKVVNFD